MQSTTFLVKLLKKDYPQFIFKRSTNFLWSHKENTIYYTPSGNYGFLLHELSHGLLNHIEYYRDIELITIERDAWELAKSIAAKYKKTIDEDFIQDNLDTYRDWLHKRSICPKCKASGLQIQKQIYKCLACNNEWKVNEARTCALRRYNTKNIK